MLVTPPGAVKGEASAYPGVRRGWPGGEYVREQVLAEAGAARMEVGRTLETTDGEPTYYDCRGAKEAKAMPGFGLRCDEAGPLARRGGTARRGTFPSVPLEAPSAKASS